MGPSPGGRVRSAQLGARGVGFGWGVFGGLGPASVVRHGDQMGSDIVAEEAPWTQLDMCEAG